MREHFVSFSRSFRCQQLPSNVIVRRKLQSKHYYYVWYIFFISRTLSREGTVTTVSSFCLSPLLSRVEVGVEEVLPPSISMSKKASESLFSSVSASSMSS